MERRDVTMTTMATGDDDDDGNGATGDKVEDDGCGMMGDDDDDDGNATGKGAMGYNDNDYG